MPSRSNGENLSSQRTWRWRDIWRNAEEVEEIEQIQMWLRSCLNLVLHHHHHLPSSHLTLARDMEQATRKGEECRYRMGEQSGGCCGQSEGRNQCWHDESGIHPANQLTS
eukprot:6266199-Amphidinium_carterae.1